MKKVNELWLKYKRWGSVTFLGSVVSSLIQVGIYAVLFILIFGMLPSDDPTSDEYQDGTSDVSQSERDCSVVAINLHGSLLTYVPEHAEGDTFFDYDVVSSEDIAWSIKTANEDDDINAIILEVDSGGGSPVAGEEIAKALTASKKPTVVVIREMGASSAYWAASGADRIFASKNSSVGDIGITMSYLDNVGKNKKDGNTFEQLSAGKYKDYGNPDKPLTAEERALFQKDVDIMYKNFIAAVAENRKLPVADVEKIANGASVLGEEAKSLGLIDEIGGMDEAEKYVLDLTGKKVDLCWE